MKKMLLVLLCLLVLTGCTAVTTPLDKGYQIGDTSKSVNVLRQGYCSEVTPLARLGLQRLVSKAGGPIPFSFCP